MRKSVIYCVILMLIIVAGCQKAPQTQQNESANVTAETNTTVTPEQNTTDTPTPKPSVSTTGAFVAAIRVENAELPSIKSVNVTFKKVEVQPHNATKWITVFEEKATANLLALGDDAFELGLNSVPAQAYKAIRIQLKTGGDVATEDGSLTSYSVPHDFLQVIKPFTVGPDETLTLVFDIDVAASSTVLDGNVLLRPEGTFTLLKGAKTTRKGGGLLTIEGGEELYSVDLTFEQLLPPGTLEEAVAECKEDCPDTCLSKSESCRTECASSVAVGCQIGGDDCREKCDPYISAFICRDTCEEESEASCADTLASACGTECNKKYSDPCVKACETACGS